MSNVYNCFVGGMQMGSVCVNQCISPRNPLFCQDCEDPRQLCAKAVPLFNMDTSTIHLGQGTNTERWVPLHLPAHHQLLSDAVLHACCCAFASGMHGMTL